MATALYLASLEPGAGSSVVALGLMELLATRKRSVSYFRPVVTGVAAEDDRLALLTTRYELASDPETMAGVTSTEAREQLAGDDREGLLAQLEARYKTVAGDAEVVLVDATGDAPTAAGLGADVHAELATRLGAGVCALIGGQGRDPDDLADTVSSAQKALARQCRVSATFVNRVDPAHVEAVRARLAESAPDRGPVFALPERSALARPAVRDLLAALETTPVCGDPVTDDREVTRVRVAASGLDRFLQQLRDGELVVVPGDRGEVALGAVAAQLAASQPNIAGLVLTGGDRPAAPIDEMLAELGEPGAPIVAVDDDTDAAVRALRAVRPTIHADDDRKIATALGLFADHVPTAPLWRALGLSADDTLGARMFARSLLARAREHRQRIVLPDGSDERILRAAQLVDRRGVAEVVLLGDVAAVRARMGALGCDLEHVAIIDPATTDETDDYAERYQQLRQHSGVDRDDAREVLSDPTHFGAMMVHLGHADGMVAGATHARRHTLRPAAEIIRTRSGSDLISSAVFVGRADRVLLYADPVVNPSPTAAELADIASTTADTAAEFGLPARVAMVGYHAGFSGLGANVDKVREATKIAGERRRDLALEGPVEPETAIAAAGPSAPRSAGGEQSVSPTGADPVVFVFPDLHTANHALTEASRAGASTIGPVLQGLAHPVNDLAGTCGVHDVVTMVAVTALQAVQAPS